MRRSTLFVSLLLTLVWLSCTGSAPPGERPSAPEPPASAAAADPVAPETTPEEPAAPEASRPQEKPRPGFEAVHEYTRMFYAGELEKLQARFSPEMREEVLPLDKLRQLHEFVKSQYGTETTVLGEDSQTKGEYRGFVRWARFSDHDGVIEVQWILREDDTIAGFFVRPAQTAPAG